MPAVSPDSATRSKGADDALLAALAGRPSDAAIERGLARLAAGGDSRLLVALVRALVCTGCPGVAARLLSTAGPAADRDPAVAAVHAAVRDVREAASGETPLADRAPRFEANRAALLRGRPHLADVLGGELDVGAARAVAVTREGNEHVVFDAGGGRLGLVFPFADHLGRAATWTPPASDARLGFMLIGVPSVPFFRRLAALADPDGYRPQIDLVEPDAKTLAIWLHLLPTGEDLDGPRVGVFAGPRAFEQYADHRVANLCRQDPTHVVATGRPGWAAPALDAEMMRRVGAAVATRRRRLVARQADYYDDRTVAGWADRFAAGEPALRVVGFTTRYSTVIQHAMRDLAAAFARRGCEVDVVCEPDDSTPIVDVWTTLAERPYDLVIVMNRLRGSIADRVHPRLPVVGWIQDYVPSLWSSDAGRSIGAYDLAVGYGRGPLTTRYGYPPERFLASSNLTDLTTYAPAPLPENELAPHRCDLAFVGHGSATVEELLAEMGAAAHPGSTGDRYLRHVVELLRERLAAGATVTTLEVLEVIGDAEARTGFVLDRSTRTGPIQAAVFRLFDRLFRHEMLEWAARWARSRSRTLRIYGRGWERHPTLHAHAAGVVENGRPLRAVAQATRITLQANVYGSLHQRMLDTVAAGGFVVSRFNPNDFIRRPMVAIARAIRERGIASLDELIAGAAGSAALAADLDEMARLGRVPAAGRDDPRRRRAAALLASVDDTPMDVTCDDSLFDSIAGLRLVPHRTAGDLPGFDETVFDGRDALHALLDRFVDDAAARRTISDRMRGSIAANDTFDALVERIIRAFRDGGGTEETT